MKCMASTQGPKVRVNAVLPGLLLTDWVRLRAPMRGVPAIVDMPAGNELLF